MSDPTGPCAVYTRGVSYSDECFFVDPDPLLDAALRGWRETGEPNEVLSLLQHQDVNSEYPDSVVEVYASFAEAEAAIHDVLLKTVRELTFVDFGFATFGISFGGSTRWYSTQDDDDSWSSLVDSTVPAVDGVDGAGDTGRLLAWCDRHRWPHPPRNDRSQMMAIAERAFEPGVAEVIDDEPEAFLADMVADQLHAAGRNDLLIDLWASFVVPLVFVGPAPSSNPADFDLRQMSFFSERKIDTSKFSAESLNPGAPSGTTPQPSAASTKTTLPPKDPGPAPEPPRKGLFGRIFGK
jgi:hypothetical protein